MGLDGKLNFYVGALLLFVLRKAEEHITVMFFSIMHQQSPSSTYKPSNWESALLLGFVNIVDYIFKSWNILTTTTT
jgi:hypothetical protein